MVKIKSPRWPNRSYTLQGCGKAIFYWVALKQKNVICIFWRNDPKIEDKILKLIERWERHGNDIKILASVAESVVPRDIFITDYLAKPEIVREKVWSSE